MKAVILEANKNLNVTEIRIPEIKSDECLLKVKVSGICSSDIYRAFENGAYFYPLIMGHEIAGEICKIGVKVKKFKIGDLVSVFPLCPCFICHSCKENKYATCTKYKYYGSRNHGGFSEYISVKEWNLINIEKIGFKNGALLEPLSVVVHCLKKSNLFNKKSSLNHNKICIIGAGFLGLMLSEVIYNKHKDLEIHIIDKNQFKLDNFSSSDRVFKYCLDSLHRWEKFLDDSENRYDYIFEMSGNDLNFKRSIVLSKPNAKVMWLGNIQSDLLIEKQVVSSILRKELKIIGTWNSQFKHKDDDWLDSISLIEKGFVSPSRYVTQFISLEELPSVLEKMYKHKSRLKNHHYIKYCMSNI